MEDKYNKYLAEAKSIVEPCEYLNKARISALEEDFAGILRHLENGNAQNSSNITLAYKDPIFDSFAANENFQKLRGI